MLKATSTARRTRRRVISRACVETLEGRRLLSLAPAVTYAASGPRDIVTGDFNGDGYADLATANNAAVGVRLNDGDGTFGDEVAYPAGGDHVPLAVVAGDLDGDGKLDLAVTTSTQRIVGYYTGYYGGQYPIYTAEGHVKVLLGNGDGSFTPAAETKDLGDGAFYTLEVGDFDTDGDLDAATTNWNSTEAVVLIGDGDGTFAAPQAVALGATAFDLTVADVNADTRLDLVTVNYTGGGVKVALGNGNGTFQPALSGPAIDADYGYAGAVGDVDGDGKIDLVVSSLTIIYGTDPYGYPTWEYHSKVNVLLGNGNGTFAAGDSFETAGQMIAPLLGDFDGDGALDLAAANSGGGNVNLFYGNGDGTFDATPETVNAGGGPNELVAADFDKDATLDLAGANYGWNAVGVMLGGYIPPPAVSIGDATVTEGDTGTVNAVFEVTLSRASDETVTVQYVAADGLAVAGKDFDLVPGTLTFAPGETSKNITVAVRGDVIDEYDEGFAVNLSNATGAALGDASGAGTIVDNDAAPSITITDVAKKEGRRGTTAFAFTVSLSAASEKDIFVDFATANGTATAGQDYLARSGTLVFAAGQTSQLLTISVNGDRTREASETFFVNLSGANGGTIVDAHGLGTIQDDDTHGKSKK